MSESFPTAFKPEPGMILLAGKNEGMRRVFEQVVERQARSLAAHARAKASLSATPSLLAYEAPLLPIAVARAKGSRITDVDGNEYVDCHMAYTATILGHSPEPVAAAVRAALDRGLQGGHFFEEQIELGELIKEMTGAERVAYLHTGGEAVNAAVRMARAVTARPRIAKFEGCYHGSNEVGLHNTWMILSGPQPPDPIDSIGPRAATAGMRTDDSYLILPFNAPLALEQIRQHADDIACVVVDPMPPFMSNWPEDCRKFVKELCAVAKEKDVPVIFDEVVCGFRLSKSGARGFLGESPQMSCYGKITSGLGIALAPVGGEAAFLDAASTNGPFRDQHAGKVWFSSTLSSSFLAVIASLAQLRHLKENYDALMGRLDKNAADLRARLDDFGKRSGIPVSLQGNPRLQMQIAVGKPEPPERTYRGVMQSASPNMMRSLMALTFYLRLNGIYTKTIPSMNLSAAHTEEDIAFIAKGIERSLNQMRQDGMLGA